VEFNIFSSKVPGAPAIFLTRLRRRNVNVKGFEGPALQL
jgi:hypothetical protein